jgi:hypothetical protein
MEQVYAVFMANGASLVEINPLISTPDGAVIALDAKISIDDNELERRADLAALRDESSEAPAEVEAPARRPHLHQARRQRRLRGERRGTLDGDDGPGQVLRRGAGQLPRYRRQLEPDKVSTRSASSPAIPR